MRIMFLICTYKENRQITSTLILFNCAPITRFTRSAQPWFPLTWVMNYYNLTIDGITFKVSYVLYVGVTKFCCTLQGKFICSLSMPCKNKLILFGFLFILKLRIGCNFLTVIKLNRVMSNFVFSYEQRIGFLLPFGIFFSPYAVTSLQTSQI